MYERVSTFPGLEGNDVITADGGTALHGTGLEDAFNGGYYYNSIDPPYQITGDPRDPAYPSSGASPLYGLLANGAGDYRTDQYRWRISDYVPFNSSLDVSFDNVNGQDGNFWGSTAFYYSAFAPEPTALLWAAAPALLMRRRRQRAR